MAEDYALDLEELRQLQTIAKRPRVLSFISTEIHNLEKEKILKEAAAPKPQAVSAPALEKAPATSALSYATLSSFSWDQDPEKIKIYLSLGGADQEKTETVFKSTSFDIKFHDVQGKNYRFIIPKLNKAVVPEKSKVVFKPTKIIVTLFKETKGTWLDLHFKEDKLKPNLDKERDPMAGIMDMMKNMYEEGDEDMKRTIAKAWSDARSGKAADPLKGYQ